MKLKELRAEKGISQQQLAIRLGVSRSTVAMWETGKSVPDAITLNAIADYFQCTIDRLMGREEKSDFGKEKEKESSQFNSRDEKDIQKRLKSALGELESTQSALMFDGEPLDDETKELLIASLERTIRQAKILAKEKYTPKKYRSKGSDINENDPENHQ